MAFGLWVFRNRGTVDAFGCGKPFTLLIINAENPSILQLKSMIVLISAQLFLQAAQKVDLAPSLIEIQQKRIAHA